MHGKECHVTTGELTGELKVYSSIAVQAVVEELTPQFEQSTGVRLAMTWGTAPMLIKRLQGGETADVLVLNRAGMDAMTKAGRIRAGSEATLASSATAMAVKTGAPRPDISSPEALKRLQAAVSRSPNTAPQPRAAAPARVSEPAPKPKNTVAGMTPQ